jgi:hypothetical protein
MTSQKLAIHAKRQTVMNKDIHCLRDLWYSIDPTSPIGSSEGHQKIVSENKRKFDKKLAVQRENAALKIHHLRKIGQEIPKKLEHFMKGIDVGSLVRKTQTGVVSRPHRK